VPLLTPAQRLTRVLRGAGLSVTDESFSSLEILIERGEVTADAVRRAIDTLSARRSKRSRAEMTAIIVQGLEAVRPGRPAQPTARVLIVTAIPVETSVVLARVTARKDRLVHGVVLSTGSLPDLDAKVAVIQSGQTNVAAAQATTAALISFEPDVVVLVGVAGGLKDSKLRDVVVADAVYQLGHISEGDERLSRGKTLFGDRDLVQVSRLMQAEGLPIRVAPVVAGDILLKSTRSETASWIKTHMNDAVAIEMEGWGTSWAAHAASVPVLVVRGISDLVDDKDPSADARDQPAAATAALDAATAIITRTLFLKEEANV
jgi:adenosylhomocysteine nucleosidase